MGSDNVKNRMPVSPPCVPTRPERRRSGGTCQPRRTVAAKRNCFRKPCRRDPIYAVLNHDKIDDDTDMKKGTILKVEDSESFLVRVRTVSDNTCVSVWPRDLCRVNGYPPQKRLLRVVFEYTKSKNAHNSRSVRMKHIARAERILADSLMARQGNPKIESLEGEIEAALVLLRYYEDHLDWERGYPNGECFFMCHIGRAILILEN